MIEDKSGPVGATRRAQKGDVRPSHLGNFRADGLGDLLGGRRTPADLAAVVAFHYRESGVSSLADAIAGQPVECPAGCPCDPDAYAASLEECFAGAVAGVLAGAAVSGADLAITSAGVGAAAAAGTLAGLRVDVAPGWAGSALADGLRVLGANVAVRP